LYSAGASILAIEIKATETVSAPLFQGFLTLQYIIRAPRLDKAMVYGGGREEVRSVVIYEDGKPMTAQVHLRLYEELNDFLPPGRRKRRFTCRLRSHTTVEKLLADLGVPADRVELVMVNGDSVDFSCPLKDGDFVSVYPVFESFDVKSLVRVRAGTLRRIRFLVTPDVARLGRCLRILGYDVLDAGNRPPEETIRVSEEEKRILLTGDPSLAQSKDLSRVYLIRELRPREQLYEILSRFDLMKTK
jgi:sulfur carrier protein ThiS